MKKLIPALLVSLALGAAAACGSPDVRHPDVVTGGATEVDPVTWGAPGEPAAVPRHEPWTARSHQRAGREGGRDSR